MTARILVVILLAGLWAAAAAAQTVGGNDPNRPELVQDPYEYVSSKGEFKVTWPSGCGELTRRETADNPDVDPFEQVLVFNVYCDQNGRHGVGCAVTSIFNLKGQDGGMPGPPEVISRLEDQMKSLGVRIVRQQPIRKELPDGSVVEGLDIQAKEPEGPGEAWLRGLLHDGDVFLLSAWKVTGGLWGDAEFQDFFSSFEPVIE